MVINIANFNFDGGSGGGGKPALLQEKTATIVQNGSQTIVPDEGFDGMSSVQINAAITGASSAIDFSPIGYDAELSADLNANINNDVAYSKTLLDAWNPSNTDTSALYIGDTKLVYAPAIDTSKVTRMSGMFDGCSHLQTVPLFNTSNVINMGSMFKGCSNLKTIPNINTSNVTIMDSMFIGCTSLTSVPELDTSKAYYFEKIFQDCSSLTTIEGISFKSFTASTMSYNYLVGYSKNKSIRKAVFKDIGYNSNAKQFNTSYIENWGINTSEIPDARQSVIDSLITYSFDRFSAGYPTCAITLSSTTKALLTADEIAQIESKGYSIA